MIKGDMVRFEIEHKNHYGTIISNVNNVLAISYQNQLGEVKVEQRKVEDVVKIGNK